MRITAYILILLLLSSCANRKLYNDYDYSPNPNGVEAEYAMEEAYDIIAEPDYIIAYDEAPVMEAVPYESEALLVEEKMLINEEINIVEVSNNRVRKSKANEGGEG